MGLGAWENLPPKTFLVVAIPHTGLVQFSWAVQFKILQPPCPFNVISNRGLPIDRARNDLVEQAQRMQASHIFFLDSDVELPPQGLAQLFSHKLPIVAGIYGSKHQNPAAWVEISKSGEQRYAAVNAEAIDRPGLFTDPNLVTGAGCLLVDMEVFNKIKKPWFKWTQGVEPNGVSEDFYFFEKCREAGIPIYIDTIVRCNHLDFSQLNWKGERSRLNA